MLASRHFAPGARGRTGMTLVELLMVLVIVVILLAVIAPVMRMTTQDRRLREAARQVNAYFAGAQARAAERGRPVFVQMERLDNNCLKLNIAEVPPPYAGDSIDAVATSILPDSGGWKVTFSGVTQLKTRKLVFGNCGERIRFNFQGHLYPIGNVEENALYISNALGSHPAGVAPAFDATAKGVSFQIYRQPIPSATAPLTLPTGTAIDLEASGSGKAGDELKTASTNITPVQVGFSPVGGVTGVNYDGNKVITGAAVHFLIGRNDKSRDENLQDPNAIWISVNPTTGIITTTDNAASATVASARTYANSAQNLGGR